MDSCVGLVQELHRAVFTGPEYEYLLGLFHHSITLAAQSGTRPLGVMDIHTSFQSLLLGEKNPAGV